MDPCINKFLTKLKHGSVERHSDSSDFDETQTIPFIYPKNGKHSLMKKHNENHAKIVTKMSVSSYKSHKVNKEYEQPNTAIFDETMIPVQDETVSTAQNEKKTRKKNIKPNNREYVVTNNQFINQTVETNQKPKPCFSNIFRRSNNNAKQIQSFKEIPQDNLSHDKTFCERCERRRIKKLNRRRRSYVVQPVYAVDNMQGPVPFGHANDGAPLSQHSHNVTRKQESNTSYELTSSESEIERRDERKYLRRRNFLDRFQKEIRKEYLKYENQLLRNRIQQYPSKRDNQFLYEAFSSPYCQSEEPISTLNVENSKLPPTSSGFWEYVHDKIRGKNLLQKCDNSTNPCFCHSPPQQGKQQTDHKNDGYTQFGANQNENYSNSNEGIPDCKSCMLQTDDLPDSWLDAQPNMEKTKKNMVTCKCSSSKKSKKPSDSLKTKFPPSSIGESGPSRLPLDSMKLGEDGTRPCQEPHDNIIKTVEDKYNGEILCIHNPPCILINGCLNLPAATNCTTRGTFWPVTQDKKSSFYHMCRKKKRPKPTYCEQETQYHPPTIEVRQALPVKPEKVVQSICNHDPPCEVVRGCYKPKYDPKLDNSCVHVPMCQRLPECLIQSRDERQSKSCEHKPKCTEVPLCSRKFVILTARETVGTQVRPKTKLVCRHEPPCIMIPRCLARIISDGYIPYEAIPDCTHQPCCDLIPACCRKIAKDMVSVSSQHPNACRVV